MHIFPTFFQDANQWFFKDKWAVGKKELLTKFLNTSKETKKLMLESDEIWDKVRPFMNAKEDKLFINPCINFLLHDCVKNCYLENLCPKWSHVYRRFV